MKIVIDKIGKTLSRYISEKTEANKIPVCFGNMGQPILYKQVDVVTDCISPTNMIPKDQQVITLDKVLDVTVPNLDATKYCITDQGAEHIEKTKEEIADAFVKKMSTCIICKVFERCDKVTSHTLKKVELEVLLNNHCH